MAPILTDTHPLNPFTPGHKHSQIPISMPPSPMVNTQTPISIPFNLWPTILTHTHPLNPFNHGPKHSQTPPSPHPLHPWPIHRHPSLSLFTHGPQYLYTHPSPIPFHPWAQTLSNTYPRHPLPTTQTQTPTPIPFHPWSLTLVDTHHSTLSPMDPILTDTHPLNPFNPDLKHSQTWNPQLHAGALGRSRGKGGIRDGVGARG